MITALIILSILSAFAVGVYVMSRMPDPDTNHPVRAISAEQFSRPEQNREAQSNTEPPRAEQNSSAQFVKELPRPEQTAPEQTSPDKLLAAAEVNQIAPDKLLALADVERWSALRQTYLRQLDAVEDELGEPSVTARRRNQLLNQTAVLEGKIMNLDRKIEIAYNKAHAA